MRKFILIYFFLLLNPFLLLKGQEYKWKQIEPKFDSLGICLEKANFMDMPRKNFRSEIISLQRIADEKQNSTLNARATYWKLWLEEDFSDISSSLYLLNRTLSSVDTLHYKYDYNRLLLLKGYLLQENGEWLNAYHIYKKLEREFKDFHDEFHIAKVYIALGVLFRRIEEYENSLKYLLKGEEELKKLHCLNCEIKNRLNISNTLYQLGQKEKAVDILKKLVKEPKVQNDTAFQIGVMISLFSVSDFKENIYSQKAYDLASVFNDKDIMIGTLINRGASFLMKEKGDSALFYYRRAYLQQKKCINAFDLQPILCGLNQTFEMLGQIDSAYHYQKKYESYRDSLLPNMKVMEINKLVAQAEIEKYEIQLKSVQEKARLRRDIMILIIGSLLGFALLVCYIFWTLRKKERIKKQFKEAENNQLITQLQNEKLLNEKYQMEIDSKNREISSTTLILSEKNNRLKDLLKQVEKFNDEGELGREQSALLSKQIKNNLTVDDEWKYFKLHFEKVHPDYFTKLKEIAPSLSENDLRLCAYIRIGMTNKQIGQMLSVLPETVKTSRYRMRKKIGLEGQETLEDFLRRI